jgi:MYXO-CTERM domain-containing protein
MSRTRLSLIALCAVLAAAVSMAPRPAWACGGFFCSTVPVDQSGEQIIFSVTPNHVTAYIQISYAGAAKDFAWVVPVASKPDISLGSQAVFQAVGGRTQPNFQLQWVGDGGSCGIYPYPQYAAGAGPTVTTAPDRGVMVIDSQDVGPFTTVTLEAHDSGELLQWLDDNGFQQPSEALPLIEHYVSLNMLFVALRLKQDATAGDIQPIVLDMATADPCVPLILTKIAAMPNMPVQVYVLGSARAFPANWFHVVVDEAKINWLSNGSNYRDLVTAAIDEAAGHGFVTEFAGSSSVMKDAIYRAGQFDTSKLAGITDPAVLIQALLQQGYPRDATMQALLRRWIPMPDAVKARGVTEREFYNNVSLYKADLDAVGYVLDIDGFIADLQARVITPLQNAQTMFDGQPYLTRLLSTVSPEEMTRDPIFTLNKDLPDVSNNHVAKAWGTCHGIGVDGLEIQLADGRILDLGDVAQFYVYGNNNTPWTAGADLPAASRIELVGPSGPAVEVAAAAVKDLDTALDTMSPEIVRTIPGSTGGAGTGGVPGSSGCGCAVASGTGASALALMGLLALALGRARRRPRR